MNAATLHSPLGPLTLHEEAGHITALNWRDTPGDADALAG